MSTLVKRLRRAGSVGLDGSPGDPLCAEAAREIERLHTDLLKIEKLRNALLDIEKVGRCDVRIDPSQTRMGIMYDIAKAALAGKPSPLRYER